ncbi:hypothetical protein [Actinospongicola halichondriae]|uniref:hypothetical protein n=1 Tax=Actinospongicola halichondriae TaxID=3236844 RepID=UPI003D57956F
MRRIAVLGLTVWIVAFASPADARPAQPDPTDAATGVVRQICDLQWIDEVCSQFAYDDPQYVSGEDPNPDLPLVQRVGVFHEHSGYSDGDPTKKPADYFAAAKTGHNTADGGGDTGVILDFLLSSEHSENEKLPITTARACIDPSTIPDGIAALDPKAIIPPLLCENVLAEDHYRKWAETLAQAVTATDFDDTAAEGTDPYTGFTAMRGYEWTNDYFNHLGVYFSRNVRNAKIDGSYVSMDFFWDWLRTPSTEGGGDDALVVFNHPGGNPSLSPFDGDLPINQLLADVAGNGNWNNIALVADVDDRVAGIEIRGGDDLSWYLRALSNGWHLGPVAAEDEHETEWASSDDDKTVMLTRGRSPRDYYFALQNHRTVSIDSALVTGEPGTPAKVPSVLFWADGDSIDDPDATVLGGTVVGDGTHRLELDLAGLPEGHQAVLLGNALDAPLALGTAGSDGRLRVGQDVAASTQAERWWVVVTCAAEVTDCGVGEDYSIVTAPIWVRSSSAQPGGVVTPVVPAPPADGDVGDARLPATGGAPTPWIVVAALVVGGVFVRSAVGGAARPLDRS